MEKRVKIQKGGATLNKDNQVLATQLNNNPSYWSYLT